MHRNVQFIVLTRIRTFPLGNSGHCLHSHVVQPNGSLMLPVEFLHNLPGCFFPGVVFILLFIMHTCLMLQHMGPQFFTFTSSKGLDLEPTTLGLRRWAGYWPNWVLNPQPLNPEASVFTAQSGYLPNTQTTDVKD